MSRRAAILAAVVSLGAVVALSAEAHARIVAAFALVEPLFAQHPVRGVLLYVGLAALSAVMVFFSGILLVPVGIHAWGHAWCFVLLWCGWVLGGLVTYSMGRHLGRPFVRRLLSPATISRYEARVYLGALVVAELPYALGAVYLGSAFIQRQYWLLLLAAAIAVGAFLWSRRRRQGRARVT
jgi:uncharacterized membrane protein YdjX (TVP38/TMEM64 family)